MMNNVTLIGRVARDIELKKTQSGVSVATIVVAVDRDFSPNGKREADFISVEVWNKVAEYCAGNIEKGRLISVQGSIRTNRYETKDGQKRTNVIVRANRITTLEKPRKVGEVSAVAEKSSVEVKDENVYIGLSPDDVPF